MYIFENRVIPVDRLLTGKPIDFGKMIENAKLYPGHCALEAFGLVMMVVGAVTVCRYAYDLGRQIGYLIG